MRVEGLHICILAPRGQNLGLIEIINQKDASKFCKNQNRCSYFQGFWSPLSPGSEMAPPLHTHCSMGVHTEQTGAQQGD